MGTGHWPDALRAEVNMFCEPETGHIIITVFHV
jgi:hypothetical protein